jgi:hypothetical protein
MPEHLNRPATLSPSATRSTISIATSGNASRNGPIHRLAGPAISREQSWSINSRSPPFITSSIRRTTICLGYDVIA